MSKDEEAKKRVHDLVDAITGAASMQIGNYAERIDAYEKELCDLISEQRIRAQIDALDRKLPRILGSLITPDIASKVSGYIDTNLEVDLATIKAKEALSK